MEIGKGLNLGLSKLKANSLFKLNDNPLANSILKEVGLDIKIGSRAAENLGHIIYRSRKYLLGEIMENLGSNITNNYLRFD